MNERHQPTRCELMGGLAIIPPDENYRTAVWLIQKGKAPWPDAPPELERAWRYLRGQDRLASVGQTSAEDPAVCGAFAIATSSAASLLVRGLVLADMDVAQIARCVNTGEQAVRVFEALFWNVRPYVAARGYVYLCIESLGVEARQATHLRLAYTHGADVFLQALGVRKLQPATAALLQELCANHTRVRALAAMQRPIDSSRAAAQSIRAYLQLRRQDMKDMRERQKLEQVQRRVETASVNLDRRFRTQQANLKAERRRLEKHAERLAKYEKALARREQQWANIVAEADEVLRQNQKPELAATRLAALTHPEAAGRAKPHVA